MQGLSWLHHPEVCAASGSSGGEARASDLAHRLTERAEGEPPRMPPMSLGLGREEGVTPSQVLQNSLRSGTTHPKELGAVGKGKSGKGGKG